MLVCIFFKEECVAGRERVGGTFGYTARVIRVAVGFRHNEVASVGCVYFLVAKHHVVD